MPETYLQRFDALLQSRLPQSPQSGTSESATARANRAAVSLAASTVFGGISYAEVANDPTGRASRAFSNALVVLGQHLGSLPQNQRDELQDRWVSALKEQAGRRSSADDSALLWARMSVLYEAGITFQLPPTLHQFMRERGFERYGEQLPDAPPAKSGVAAPTAVIVNTENLDQNDIALVFPPGVKGGPLSRA